MDKEVEEDTDREVEEATDKEVEEATDQGRVEQDKEVAEALDQGDLWDSRLALHRAPAEEAPPPTAEDTDRGDEQ